MFMVNLLSYTHQVNEFLFIVYTVDSKKQNIILNYEIPELNLHTKNQMKGEEKSQCYRRFKLQPNMYIFNF